MFLHDQVFAIIPARGGSKGLPGKNLMKLAGKSLLERAIDSAKNCLFVDAVVVSSDDTEILDEALRLGAINHRRADEAATDESTAAGVITEFLNNAEVEIDPSIDPWIVYLQPTSPLRTSEMVEQVFELQPLFAEAYSANRQTLPQSYLPNGAIYCFKLSEFKRENRFPFAGALAYVMSEKDSIDIDTPEDFEQAKAILEK
jgi:CMP-N-acetylneuraminic acid synthetase